MKRSGDNEEMHPLYHGDNGAHELWEGPPERCHTFAILRNHGETCWSFHEVWRDQPGEEPSYSYLGSAKSAEEAAKIVGVVLATDHIWNERGGGVMVLEPVDTI